MENLPIVVGGFCLLIGFFFVKVQVKRFLARRKGTQSLDIRLLLYGIVFLIAGIILVLRKV